MTENKMAEVAKLFGKRIGEDFKIKGLNLYFRFMSCGLMVWEKEANCWLPAPHDVFMDLIQGKRVID